MRDFISEIWKFYFYTNILFLRKKVVLKLTYKFFLNFYSCAIGANGVNSNSQFALRRAYEE